MKKGDIRAMSNARIIRALFSEVDSGPEGKTYAYQKRDVRALLAELAERDIITPGEADEMADTFDRNGQIF